MKTSMQNISSTKLLPAVEYETMSLIELAQRIAHKSDKKALDQLHNHRVFFSLHKKKLLPLVEHIGTFKESRNTWRRCNYNIVAMDAAYDLTVDKFSNLPCRDTGRCYSKPSGPDCRYYYGAFVDYVMAQFEKNPACNPLEAETAAARMLLSLVRWHFYLSCLETKRRSQKLVRRCRWNLNGKTLYIWLPVDIAADKCRKWLQKHIDNVDPDRPGEQDRIQHIVNERFARRRLYSLHESSLVEQKLPLSPPQLLPSWQDEISVNGLAKAVGDEKVQNIGLQRPAIRALGQESLKKLIVAVFNDLAWDNYEASTFACRFGISEATLSRFAGCRWNRQSGDISEGVVVPDLWQNTAQVLAGHIDFVEAATKAGVWKQVCQVLETTDRRDSWI